MDWAKQSEEMLKNWTESQQQMWDQWMKMMAPLGTQAPGAELWQQTIDLWEKAVKESANAQADWMAMWFESLETMSDVPEEFKSWAEQAVDMNKQWAGTQAQMWDGWFTALKNMSPPGMTGGWDAESKKAMDAWRESAAQIVEANKKLAESWTMFNTTVNGK